MSNQNANENDAAAHEKQQQIKKILGNPKFTFVLGGPASGKGTQCAKLVEEFGYTHISTGDLMRAEIAKGSKEGAEIKKIVNEGGLVPAKLTVQVLINALIATPSKNYLIDGFPRAIDQAEEFEKTVAECQSVLYFNTPEEICVARCLERAKTSGRSDDTEEIIAKRLKTYNEASRPVVEMYTKLQKVREVNGGQDAAKVWIDTRSAMLPQITFIIGPKGSGKSTLGQALCKRTNMASIRFGNFIRFRGLENADDETKVLALISALAIEIKPRVMIEDFPQNAFQAKFFIKNGVAPSNVFVLKCSQDTSQERMIKHGQKEPGYIPSSILSQKIKKYNDACVELIPLLRQITEMHEINTETTYKTSFKEMCKHVEPTIVHVRSGAGEMSKAARREIIAQIEAASGPFKYTKLDIEELKVSEQIRGTEIGRNLKNAKRARHDLVVDMIKKIIYNGIAGHNKFILVGFPDGPEQASFFETNCAQIAAIVYATDAGQPTVEINGNLSVSNLDTIFQKNFKLKIMKKWDPNTFLDILGQKVNWALITGREYSGRAMVAAELGNVMKSKIIDMSKIAEECKKKMGTEEEPFEGEVPITKVQEAVYEMIENDRVRDEKFIYLFDGFLHKTTSEFIEFSVGQFGAELAWIHCQTDNKKIEERYKQAKEIEGDLPEDAVAELQEQAKQAEALKLALTPHMSSACLLQTDTTVETLRQTLRNMFGYKVVIVNHEKRLPVDTACSNLAIKYNMLYLSVYQLIRMHVKKQTPIGKLLAASKKPKALNEKVKLVDGIRDEFEEEVYSAVHFDMDLVMSMVQTTISEKRAGESFVLLEGLFNNQKLQNESDQLSLRYMDELFLIEKKIGEVTAIVSLQYKEQDTNFVEDKWEVFEPKIVVEKKVRAEGEEGEEAEPEAAPEEDAAKGLKFDPSEFKWTVTERRAKNLPQVFKDFKGINCNCELKKAETFSTQTFEAISKCLEDFCDRLVATSGANNIYQQVIFKE